MITRDQMISLLGGGALKGVKKVDEAINPVISPVPEKPDISLRFVTPTPTQQPQVLGTQTSPMPQATPTPFKFQMGEKDYSRFKPQLEKYYTEQNSPALPYTQDIIATAEKYGVDPRVISGIMFSESSNMKNYPEESYNPVGYLVDGGGVQGLKNAGFTSIPHMLDRVTSRFGSERNSYPKFTENPNIDTLQSSYNANSSEAEQYKVKLKAFMDYLEQKGKE